MLAMLPHGVWTVSCSGLFNPHTFAHTSALYSPLSLTPIQLTRAVHLSLNQIHITSQLNRVPETLLFKLAIRMDCGDPRCLRVEPAGVPQRVPHATGSLARLVQGNEKLEKIEATSFHFGYRI